MPATTILREDIQPRPQVIKLTLIIQLYEIYLINDNRQSEHAKGDLNERKKTKKNGTVPRGLTLRMGVGRLRVVVRSSRNLLDPPTVLSSPPTLWPTDIDHPSRARNHNTILPTHLKLH